MGISVIGGATGGGGGTLRTVEFTATGSWTAPTDVQAIEIFAVGGGGAGGSRGADNTPGGGGGGGQVLNTSIPVTPGATYTVTVGAGGAAAGYATTAGRGADTTFGSLLTAFGGGAGLYGAQTSNFPSLGATSGGAGGRYANSAAGGGGGAWGNGQSANRGGNYGSAFPHANGEGVYAQAASHGGVGGMSSASVAMPSGCGGEGFMGFGGGGGGGNYFDGYSGKGAHGGGDGGGGSGSGVGFPGRANSGGGGGGCRSNTASASSGGNGGSGYVKIKYWTAG